jgi:hypothetical protein
MNVLVIWIRFPMRRFTATSYNYTRPIGKTASGNFNSRRQVHERCNRAQYALRMIYQAYQLTKSCLPPQINNAAKTRVEMSTLTYLDEQDFSLKPIDYFLIANRFPPFDRYVVLPSSGDDPERDIFACQFMHLRVPCFFLSGQMNVASEYSWFDPKLQAFVQEIDKPMKAMIWGMVRPIDQGIGTVNTLCLWVIVGNLCNVRIIFPNLRAACSNVGSKISRIALVKITDRRGKHYNVAGRKAAMQDEFPHKHDEWSSSNVNWNTPSTTANVCLHGSRARQFIYGCGFFANSLSRKDSG